MDSFGALKNNSFGDFNKEDVLGFIDAMTLKTKKAQLVLKDRVEVLNQEREHLVVKIAEFEKLVLGLEQHLEAERDNVRQALLEKDALTEKIFVEREAFDTVLARKQKELAESEQEILQFAAEKAALNARLTELETKSRHYDDIKASVSSIRLDAETDVVKSTEEAQEQVMEAVHIIDNIAEEVANMKQQFDASKEPSAPVSPAVPADSPKTNSEFTPELVLEIRDAGLARSHFEETKQPDLADDDPVARLNALYQALDQSVERLQGIKTQFIQKATLPNDEA